MNPPSTIRRIPPKTPAAWIGDIGRDGLQRIRTRLGLALRTTVAGSDAQVHAAQIWDAEGPRWFTPEDPVWTVHSDAAMFPGGVAALLVQSLHPLAMAGVAGHSGYRGDPWGRLQRTSRYIAATTFGTIEHATGLIARIRCVHGRISGHDERGRAYRADDPRLLAWVHAAEIWSFLQTHRMYGPQPISAAQADEYVAQAGVAAAELGVPDPPRTVAELEQVIADYRPELEVSEAALEATRFLLFDMPVHGISKLGYLMVVAGGVAAIPPWARRMLGIRIPEFLVAPVLAPLGRVSTRLIGWSMTAVAGEQASAT